MTPADELTFDGITQPITEWALDYGIPPNLIVYRLNSGFSIEDAITTPMRVGRTYRLPSPTRRKRNAASATEAHMQKASKPPRSDVLRLTLNNETRSLSEWSRITGVSVSTMYRRLERGWTTEQILTTPTRKKAKPGVVFNFAPSMGTGAGGTAQEIPEITFSDSEVSQ